MTILESLREEKERLENGGNGGIRDDEIFVLIQQYDLALENALLKLKNRAVQISDLKNMLHKQSQWLEEANQEIMRLKKETGITTF